MPGGLANILSGVTLAVLLAVLGGAVTARLDICRLTSGTGMSPHMPVPAINHRATHQAPPQGGLGTSFGNKPN